MTHGHEEHFPGTPAVVKASGATVVAHQAVTDYLRWRQRVPAAQRGAPDATVIEAVPGSVIDVAVGKPMDMLPLLRERAAA